MAFFKGVFRSNTATPPPPTGAEQVERLCDRVQSSSLLDDRREAVKSIKNLSKKYKLEVGTLAMQTLIEVLQNDRSDADICNYALDTLENVFTYDPTNEEEQKNLPEDITVQFSEVYIKNASNISLLFELIDEFEFHIRWPAVKLLHSLTKNCPKDMQDAILVCPMAISKLMDLLVDTREIIRNDVLLLMNNLTKAHSNIQKIIAFESGFERILDIVEAEGVLDGGVVVEDAFNLLYTLLKGNPSNQNFFKEGNFIKRLCRFFEIASAGETADWAAQKTQNMNLMLKVVRTLVAPANQQQIITDCQKAINYCGLLHRLCALFMVSGVPSEVLTETINTVAEVIRGNGQNQQFFATIMVPSVPQRPLIVVLLMSMINEKQAFELRCSILYCIQSFLNKNEAGQSQIIDTLLPNESNAQAPQSITAGQLLVGGLFSTDFLSNWFCASALAHAILDNTKEKEKLLRVQLAFNDEATNTLQPISLMHKCVSLMIKHSTQSMSQHFQTIVALQMLLSSWLLDSANCVTFFVSQQGYIPYLISQISSTETEEKSLIIQGLCAFMLGACVMFNSNQVPEYTIDKLKETIKKRIGIEQFEDKLEYVSQCEAYTKALHKPTLNYTTSSQILFDYEFTRLFKSNETALMKALSSKDSNGNGASLHGSTQSLAMSANEHNALIVQYKDFIREQDIQLTSCKLKLNEQTQLNQTLVVTLKQLEEQYQLLKDQNTLLRTSSSGTENSNEMAQLRYELDNLKIQNNYLREVASRGGNPSGNVNLQPYHDEIESLRKQILNEQLLNHELKSQIELKDEELALLRTNERHQSPQASEKLVMNPNLTVDSRLNELKELLSQYEERCTEQADYISRLQQEKGLAEENLSNLMNELQKRPKSDADVKTLKDENESLKSSFNALNEEQENLLLLLQDMEEKLKKYKGLLKQYGHTEELDDDLNGLGDEEDLDENDLK